MVRDNFLGAPLNDPAILVADDVIALATTLEEMQLIADTCREWVRKNGLNWNPSKSQFLRMIAQALETQETTQRQTHTPLAKQNITLDGTRIEESMEAD